MKLHLRPFHYPIIALSGLPENIGTVTFVILHKRNKIHFLIYYVMMFVTLIE